MSRRTSVKIWAVMAALMVLAAMGLAIGQVYATVRSQMPPVQPPAADAQAMQQLLNGLSVNAAAPADGYDRDRLFGTDWAPVGQCDTRAQVLARDLTAPVFSTRTPCRVIGGTLTDPYTGTRLVYEPGAGRIEVDHVVSLFNAWTSGAQTWDQATRTRFANDTTNLLAVSADANQDKGGSDAATWTPSDPAAWCGYAAIQITVKHTYDLHVRAAEKAALIDLLQTC